MEVNPEYKSGVESLRWLDVSSGFLPATPAAKLIPNVLPCFPLDPVSEAERGAVLCGQCTASICLCPGYTGAGIAERVSALDWLSLCYAAIITLPVSNPGLCS